ncbi:Werner Syndrome-like exonuclease [Senna tora]|uniref:Werner Syndrome-like exonuclease n=1 Tax=Senna tora TaxID=362788 RepID=A0A834X471_9FABA|nr:Werner Syndrome-like exonuclease [Senna tora]
MTSTGKKTTVTFNPNTLKYTVNHNGKSTETTVTNISSEAEQWFKLYCKNKIKATVIGMAMRHKLNTSNEPFHLRTSEAATLHLYVDDKCLIIQLLNMDSFSNSLKDFFMNPMLIFAGIHVDNINNRLFKECGFRACKTLHIRDHARMKWPGKFSEYPELKRYEDENEGNNSDNDVEPILTIEPWMLEGLEGPDDDDIFAKKIQRVALDGEEHRIEVEKSIDTLQKLCFKRAFKTLDIMEGARMRWPEKFSKDAGLKVLAREVANMHIDLPHHVSLSKWDASVLFLEQVEYATMEAYASYCVAHKLLIGE